MAERYVLDTSAVLAVLQSERGADLVLRAGAPFMSTASLAELLEVGRRRGLDPHEVHSTVQAGLGVEFAALTEQQALRSEQFVDRDVSLGDRCCLALAGDLGIPALTADPGWKRFDQIEVVLIR